MKNLLKLLFCAGIIIASSSCKKKSRLTSDSDPPTSESVQKMRWNQLRWYARAGAIAKCHEL